MSIGNNLNMNLDSVNLVGLECVIEKEMKPYIAIVLKLVM